MCTYPNLSQFSPIKCYETDLTPVSSYVSCIQSFCKLMGNSDASSCSSHREITVKESNEEIHCKPCGENNNLATTERHAASSESTTPGETALKGHVNASDSTPKDSYHHGSSRTSAGSTESQFNNTSSSTKLPMTDCEGDRALSKPTKDNALAEVELTADQDNTPPKKKHEEKRAAGGGSSKRTKVQFVSFDPQFVGNSPFIDLDEVSGSLSTIDNLSDLFPMDDMPGVDELGDLQSVFSPGESGDKYTKSRHHLITSSPQEKMTSHSSTITLLSDRKLPAHRSRFDVDITQRMGANSHPLMANDPASRSSYHSSQEIPLPRNIPINYTELKPIFQEGKRKLRDLLDTSKLEQAEETGDGDDIDDANKKRASMPSEKAIPCSVFSNYDHNSSPHEGHETESVATRQQRIQYSVSVLENPDKQETNNTIQRGVQAVRQQSNESFFSSFVGGGDSISGQSSNPWRSTNDRRLSLGSAPVHPPPPHTSSSCIETDHHAWRSTYDRRLSLGSASVHPLPPHTSSSCIGTDNASTHQQPVANLSSDKAGGSITSRNRGDINENFPQKLMTVLSSQDCEQAISWLSNGQAFAVRDRVALVSDVLPRFFDKEVKFKSFIRKLNRWGFERRMCENKGVLVYRHKLFMRDNPDLCALMRTKTCSDAKK